VFVEGRLRTRTWQAADGQNRNTTEVIANNIQFLRGASKPQQKGVADSNLPAEEIDSIDMTAEGFEKQSGSAKNNNKSDEEIPF